MIAAAFATALSLLAPPPTLVAAGDIASCRSSGDEQTAAIVVRTPGTVAVLGDIVAVARNRVNGTRGPAESTYADLPVLPMADTITRYHVALDVADRPGVLARVADAFAENDVSIQAVRQEGQGQEAQLVIVTHRAPDGALSATIEGLHDLEIVREVASVMRVEGDE